MRVPFRYAPVGAVLILGMALTMAAFIAQQQRRDPKPASSSQSRL